MARFAFCHVYIRTNLYGAKNRENEWEAVESESELTSLLFAYRTEYRPSQKKSILRRWVTERNYFENARFIPPVKISTDMLTQWFFEAVWTIALPLWGIFISYSTLEMKKRAVNRCICFCVWHAVMRYGDISVDSSRISSMLLLLRLFLDWFRLRHWLSINNLTIL